MSPSKPVTMVAWRVFQPKRPHPLTARRVREVVVHVVAPARPAGPAVWRVVWPAGGGVLNVCKPGATRRSRARGRWAVRGTGRGRRASLARLGKGMAGTPLQGKAKLKKKMCPVCVSNEFSAFQQIQPVNEPTVPSMPKMV